MFLDVLTVNRTNAILKEQFVDDVEKYLNFLNLQTFSFSYAIAYLHRLCCNLLLYDNLIITMDALL